MVKVDKDKCIGCSYCASVCPEGFVMENGKAKVKSKDASCIDDAINGCPVSAISK